MQFRITVWMVVLLFWVKSAGADFSPVLWREITTVPPSNSGRIVNDYKLFRLSLDALQRKLYTSGTEGELGVIVELPAPDGSFWSFRVWETPVMASALASKYPNIKTYTATSLDKQSVTAKLSYTPAGFHAIVYNGNNTWFIDPWDSDLKEYCQVYYRRNCLRNAADHMGCEIEEQLALPPATPADVLSLTRHGDVKRVYRLALACTGEYANAVAGPNPSTAAVLARMVVTINRVNGLYERELAISLQLVDKTDTLIFLDGSSDPYSNNNGYAMMAQNQLEIDKRIGSGSYDIGHVFSTGGGGVAQKGSVCDAVKKAMGVTGSPNPQGDAYDVDYVAHELGHQFGADHTFNSRQSACGGGNREGSSAYEPGSGSTIMGYAGLCGPDNLQSHGDAYFHAYTLSQIAAYVSSQGNCATNSVGPTPPELEAYAHTYSIPFLTPFELDAPRTQDVHTYCWEEWDLSNDEFSWAESRLTAPIFRSFFPDTAPRRVFPSLPRLVNNEVSYVGEKLPDTTRLLHFRATARKLIDGLGSFHCSGDMITINVVRTASPFTVTAPDQMGIKWKGATQETVTWDVGGTDQQPIGCTEVDVLLSLDGGFTYPIRLAEGIPNTGTARVTVPNVNTTATARIKVKGKNNVFFDISNYNFEIEHNPRHPYPSDISDVESLQEELTLSPVPAQEYIRLEAANKEPIVVFVHDGTGRVIWSGTIKEQLELSVGGWTNGMYYFRWVEVDGSVHSKKVLVQH